MQVQLKQEIAWRILWTQSCIFLQTIVLHNKHKLEMIFVRMIKQQDHLLTRRTEPVGVKQDLHSLQASGKSHKAHLWYVPRFELLQNRMDTKGPVPSSIGKLIPGRLLKALVFLYAFEESQGLRMRNFTWNIFPIKNLLIDALLTPIVESTYLIHGRVRHASWGGSVYTTQSGWAQGQGFPLWVVEGNEVGPLIASTPRATGVESTVR